MSKPRRKQKPPQPAAAKRERFCHEYLIDLNASQAAIRAGYSPNGADVAGSRLLADVRVSTRVEELKKVLYATRYGVTIERTLRQIARIAYGDPRILYNLDGSLKLPHELDEDGAALLAGVETDETYVGGDAEAGTKPELTRTRKVKVRSSERALAMAMAYLGMNKTVNPLDGSGGMVLSINLSGAKL